MLFFASNVLIIFHVIQSNGQNPNVTYKVLHDLSPAPAPNSSDLRPTTLTLAGIQIFGL